MDNNLTFIAVCCYSRVQKHMFDSQYTAAINTWPLVNVEYTLVKQLFLIVPILNSFTDCVASPSPCNSPICVVSCNHGQLRKGFRENCSLHFGQEAVYIPECWMLFLHLQGHC